MNVYYRSLIGALCGLGAFICAVVLWINDSRKHSEFMTIFGSDPFWSRLNSSDTLMVVFCALLIVAALVLFLYSIRKRTNKRP